MLCLSCGKKLQVQSYGIGAYGNGHFCGIACGCRWAQEYLRQHPDLAGALQDITRNALRAQKKEGK